LQKYRGIKYENYTLKVTTTFWVVSGRSQ